MPVVRLSLQRLMPSVAVEQPASKPRVSVLDIEKVRVVKRLL